MIRLVHGARGIAGGREMALFRSKADRTIDRAHSAIAGAEMLLNHSFTDEAKAAALAELNAAQAFLCRAVAARDAWNRTEHGDYDEYPGVT
jgi:hypothetical protein